MKKYNVRLNVLHSQWLHTEAESKGLKISEVVRSILETQQKSRAFSRMRPSPKTSCSDWELALVRRTILSYQLLESLLLNEDPESMRYDAAYANAEQHLEAMGIQGRLLKSYYLSICLSPAQSQWLEREALHSGKRVSQVLEQILRSVFEESRAATLQVDLVQQEQLRFSIMICVLLEHYIVENYENGAALIDQVKQKTEILLEEWMEGQGQGGLPIMR